MAEITGIIAYLLLQLFIGYWVSRYIKTETDYFIAGRRLGMGLASFSIFATWFGAETCMGSAAAIFDKGLSGARADPFGYTICLVLAGIFLAGQLWKRKYITLADLYRHRYSENVERLAILILAPTSLLWAAAQIRAFGQIISATTPFDVNMAITFAAIFIIIYTFLGGLLGDVIHDLMQGTILIIGVVIMLVFALNYFGGAIPAFQKITPEQLKFVAPDESFMARIDKWMVPVLGSLVAQEFVARVLACKSEKTARNASFMGAGLYLIVGIIPVILGLLGPYFPLDLEHNDQFLISLARHLLPTAFFIIFVGALLAAILSTVDSTLLSISALVSHNLLSEDMKKNLPQKRKVLMARGVVILSGISAFFMAISAEGIYELVQSASSFGTAGLLVITIAALWTKKFGGSKAAFATLLTGIVSTIIFQWFYEIDAPFITSIMLSLTVYFSLAISGKLRKTAA